MKYLLEEDCREHCDYHQVCVKYGKLYRDGCVLDGEDYEEGSPGDAKEREKRIKRLHTKLTEMQ
ncbi:MAG TPA: hypothetical protein DEF34_13110 [Desulfotomaculum sp.]|nr:MAG: hypothetical protein VR67_01725 [Peptococcaceae bacterium BRH_c8a]KJS71994.1 MAG: hypothetical protein JL56_13760 [Desulfotomaculum sp. BICA1-6]HBX24551.1 hypothetical protein [Desulfotomaculum sp.]